MTVSPSPDHTPPATPGGGDPSMEDILASIRRILSEDETEPATGPASSPSGSDVVPLDPSMMVEPPPVHVEPPPVHVEPPPVHVERPPVHVEPPPVHVEPPPVHVEPPLAAPHSAAPVPPAPPAPPATPAQGTLLAPETAAAASSSVGSLLRTLASERQHVAVRAGGPTIEDLVREEIRPLLKTWLDANLPAMVERLVRAEIERVVGRALS
jgi:cell pole-organizing protein PopZ